MSLFRSVAKSPLSVVHHTVFHARIKLPFHFLKLVLAVLPSFDWLRLPYFSTSLSRCSSVEEQLPITLLRMSFAQSASSPSTPSLPCPVPINLDKSAARSRLGSERLAKLYSQIVYYPRVPGSITCQAKPSYYNHLQSILNNIVLPCLKSLLFSLLYRACPASCAYTGRLTQHESYLPPAASLPSAPH